MVVANQVFEHIHDLEGTAGEIARVPKPGGRLVSLFPIKAVIREPHLWVPFIHHFPRNGVRRFYYREPHWMAFDGEQCLYCERCLIHL
jgi:SAM-dependent methyltransferase